MSVSVKNLNYLQTSSPQMAGTAGYLDAILYAGLVTGYNSRNINSITVSSNVATVTTSTAHGYGINDIVAISGANESVFNSSFCIKAVLSTTTFTFDVTTADGSATGTITCKIAPLGWTREFTGTNKSVYRQATGNRYYLRIDDTQAKYATVNMYETMSSVDVGTGKSTDVYWVKSDAASTAAREWYLVGNSQLFYLFTAWHSSYPTQHIGYVFGDFNSVKAGDIYNTMIIGHNATAPTNSSYSTSFQQTSFNSTNNSGQYLIRGVSGVERIGVILEVCSTPITDGLYYWNSIPEPSRQWVTSVPYRVRRNSSSYLQRKDAPAFTLLLKPQTVLLHLTIEALWYLVKPIWQ